MKILAVDDDVIFLELLTQVLKAGGYDDVLVAQSARDASSLIAKSEPIDVFLLDIKMPETDGIALCRDIRKMPLYADTPILMLTAVTDLDSIDSAFAAGATDYVTKPLKSLELGTRIKLACLLSTQLRLASKRAQSLDSVKSELDRIRSHKFEDAFEVEGTIDYLKLENYLLKLPPGSYAMRIFGLKIMNAEDIFEELPSSDFANSLNQVARQIRRRFLTFKSLLTYAGSGIFGCVLFERDDPQGRTLAKLDGETRWSTYVLSGDGVERKLHLVKGACPPPHIWSGVKAAAALEKCIGKASERCKDEILQEHLNIERIDTESVIPIRIVKPGFPR